MKGPLFRALLRVCIVASLPWCDAVPAARGGPVASDDSAPWVRIGDDGKLRYRTDAAGDRIMDFSHAGYMGGGVKLPEPPVCREVAPSGADDSAAIQAAIDAVARMPVKDGFRGAVLLKPGKFRCSKTVTLSQDGIVLRGSGSGREGTSIDMTGEAHVCFSISGESSKLPKESPSTVYAPAEERIPSGAARLTLKDARGLAVGDDIRIRRLMTVPWIRFMGMDTLVRDGRAQTWIRPNSPMAYDRKIRAIDGNTITLDVPVTDAVELEYVKAGDVTVVRTAPPKRLRQCGVEALRIESPPAKGELTTPNNDAFLLDRCEDCWVRDAAILDTLGNVNVRPDARRITVTGVRAVHTKTVEGHAHSADFSIAGSQVLIDRCTSSGNGSFYVATMSMPASLNVVLHCEFLGNGKVQPHMRWSTGLLVDCCRVPGGAIEFINRDIHGSGHGWTMGWGVVWHCRAKTLDIEQPPGAINWCHGCTGEIKSPPGPWLTSAGSPPEPESLYLAQLRERLGERALKAIGY